MLSRDEKYLVRVFFKLKVHEANGTAFETLFTSIMNYTDNDFRQVKPWGNIGDRKNDGYIEPKGIYFQVYAPEKPGESYPEVIEKINKDFKGLFQQWPNVEEFYFVFNDKYLGVNPDCSKTIDAIKKKYSLRKSGFILPKDLEDTLMKLTDDQIFMIVGRIPDPANIAVLDYSVLKEVIDTIKQFPIQSESGNFVVPDWDKKIQFNELSPITNTLLTHGSFHLSKLDVYLNNQSRFLAEELRNRMREIYLSEKANLKGDQLFWKIVAMICPEQTLDYQNAAIVIMAKYFETCDIFEEPQE